MTYKPSSEPQYSIGSIVPIFLYSRFAGRQMFYGKVVSIAPELTQFSEHERDWLYDVEITVDGVKEVHKEQGFLIDYAIRAIASEKPVSLEDENRALKKEIARLREVIYTSARTNP